MAVEIGSRYLEHLETLAHLTRHVRSGGFQENPELNIIKVKNTLTMHSSKGRVFSIIKKCKYDKCSDKKVDSDLVVRVSYDNGAHVENYFFHSECLDSLTNDRRFPENMN